MRADKQSLQLWPLVGVSLPTQACILIKFTEINEGF